VDVFGLQLRHSYGNNPRGGSISKDLPFFYAKSFSHEKLLGKFSVEDKFGMKVVARMPLQREN
jgi:hypothetical protein